MKRRREPDQFHFFLIGPITLPESATAFHSVAHGLRGQGFTVASPAEACLDAMPDFVGILRASLPLLAASKRAVLLTHWRNCPLARLLVYLAQRLKLPCHDVTTMAEIPELRTEITFSQAVGDPARARLLLRELNSEMELR